MDGGLFNYAQDVVFCIGIPNSSSFPTGLNISSGFMEENSFGMLPQTLFTTDGESEEDNGEGREIEQNI